MTEDSGVRFLPASHSSVLEVLLNPHALPTWNPAFSTMAGPPVPVVDRPYQLSVRGGFGGRFLYRAIAADRVDMEWEIWGLVERCHWSLDAVERGTLVTHTVDRSGVLAVPLRATLRGLADLRLDRLASIMQDDGLRH